MRLWIARHSDLSIRERLVGQLLLSILSGDLRAGQRLPSTRELGRRLRLHAVGPFLATFPLWTADVLLTVTRTTADTRGALPESTYVGVEAGLS